MMTYADKLKGRLMLVHGEIDNNVHPANTMRLVDALIKANKRFDLLILPGKRHAFGDSGAGQLRHGRNPVGGRAHHRARDPDFLSSGALD